MKLTERIDILLLDARKQAGDFNARTFGQKKSPAFLEYRQKIFDITDRKGLEKMLKDLEKIFRQKKINMKEFQDLTDKVLIKVQRMKAGVMSGKKVKGMVDL
jgi:hypothetical protein